MGMKFAYIIGILFRYAKAKWCWIDAGYGLEECWIWCEEGW